MATRRQPARVTPRLAIPGGRVRVEAGAEPFSREAAAGVRFGTTPGRIASLSSRRLVAVVPPVPVGGSLPIALDGVDEPVGTIEVGDLLATDLHQVDGPAFDRDGNLYATVSGTRGQRVPVSVFRIRPDGTRDALASGIVNATSLAFDPFGDLHVTSRFDGTVFRVKPDGTVEKVASDLGVACGLAFTADGTMYVGDRTGTLFRVNAAGRVIPFATLPPSIAAFHVAIGLEEEVYVSGPTLATRDGIYRVDRRGEVSLFAEGFGRPQGLAVDGEGTLHVAEALAGASGVYRVEAGGRRELVVTGDGVIGLAFHPKRGVVVASSDSVYLFPRL